MLEGSKKLLHSPPSRGGKSEKKNIKAKEGENLNRSPRKGKKKGARRLKLRLR